MTAIDYIEDESLIPVEDIVVTLTQKGYIKRMNSDNYKSQNRGGVGIKGMATNEEDFVSSLISLTTHDYVLFFTNKGKVYRIKGYEIPLFSRQSKGLPIVNLLPLEKEEVVTTMLKIDREENSKYIVFCTQNGLVKRTNIKEFNSIRKNGKIAITLKDDDELIAARKTDETKDQITLNLVFTKSDGKFTGTDITKYPFEIIHKELGIEKCRFYDLRGSYATKVLNSGVEIRDVADMLGHRNIETTENYYVSSTDTSRKCATDNFDKMIQSEVINEISEYLVF